MEAARSKQPGQGGDQVDKKNGQIAHRRMVAGRRILRNLGGEIGGNNNSPATGHSEVLTAYLSAMAKFHTYSFGNIQLIARQRAVTCCDTSLESMNMRSRTLLEASNGA